MIKENNKMEMRLSDNDSAEFAYYAQIETLGGVDGPGLRLVVFLQGCPMRCLYCHNPETTPFSIKDKKITIDEIVNLYYKNESFYKNGGVTISGGEAMAQPNFVIALFKKLKSLGINTCLDTAAGPLECLSHNQIKDLLTYTDLFLIDIKHPDLEVSIRLTGHSSENQLELIRLCEKSGNKYWVRHVFVPPYSNEKPEYMINLGKMLGNLKHMTKFELLPYHNMAIVKYDNLHWAYQLREVNPPTPEEIKDCMERIAIGFKEVKDHPENGLIIKYAQ